MDEMEIRAALRADAINEGVCNQDTIYFSEIRSGLDFVAKYDTEIRKLMYKLCAYMHNRQHDCDNNAAILNLVDDVYSECILEKCQIIYDKYNPAIGTLKGFMMNQLYLYARKWFQSLRLRESRAMSLQSTETDFATDDDKAVAALLDSEQVILILAQLSPQDAQLVRMHVCYSQSFDEIAERLGGAPSTWRVKFNSAMRRLIDWCFGNV